MRRGSLKVPIVGYSILSRLFLNAPELLVKSFLFRRNGVSVDGRFIHGLDTARSEASGLMRRALRWAAGVASLASLAKAGVTPAPSKSPTPLADFRVLILDCRCLRRTID